MTDTAISLKGLSKIFGDLHAVKDIDLEIEKGEMFGLIGPDGAGKTTLIRMMCCVTKPSRGEGRILGFDLLKGRSRIIRRIGYLSQRFSLYYDLSVDENIEFFAEINGVRDYRERKEELLAFTRLSPFKKRLAGSLSGGMKQKLSLVCTLIHRPEVLFLDEPTTGVDPVSRRDFFKILSSISKSGITIMMTTPYLDEAERCSRVALMNNGEIMVTGRVGDIKEMIKGRILELVLGNVRSAYSILKGLDCIKSVQAFGDRLNIELREGFDNIDSIRAILKQSGLDITEMREVSPSLENVFITLIEKANAG